MRISDWSSDVCSSDLPVATVVSAGPGFEGDVQARLDIRTKDIRRQLEEAGLPELVVEGVARAVQAQAGDDAVGIVADAKGIVTTTLVGIDDDAEVVQVEDLPRHVPFARARVVNCPHGG